MSELYDLIVVGSGPGGYVCAIRASQLGMRVALVEKRKTDGGTCLNVGCIPSKALLHVSELFERANRDFPRMGIKTGATKMDHAASARYRDEVVAENVRGITFLLKKNKIDRFHGTGKLREPGKLDVLSENGATSSLTGKSIVIATGSEPFIPEGIQVDEARVVTSTGALALTEPPGKLVVIGAGVIGLELGSAWRRLGSHVSIIEAGNRILPGMDAGLANSFHKILEEQGLVFKFNTRMLDVEGSRSHLSVHLSPPEEGSSESIAADVLLVAIGRKPYTEGLGLQEMGIALDEQGRIRTDRCFKTNLDGVYAIGDVIAGPMLAHKASEEGVAVAELLAGQAGHVNYDVIPSVVYTMPEVAWIGKNEEELRQEGLDYTVGTFPLSANGRARILHEARGYVKLLSDRKTDCLLGAHIIGPGAGDMIHEVAVLMEFGGATEDLARTCHAHPTVSEAIKEAALSAEGRAIHR